MPPIERTTAPSVMEVPSRNRFFMLNHLDVEEDVCDPEEICQHSKESVTVGDKLQGVVVVDKRCASLDELVINNPLAEGMTSRGDACSGNESEQLSVIEKTQTERDRPTSLTVAKAKQGGEEPKEQRTDEEGDNTINVSDHGVLTVTLEGIKEITPIPKPIVNQCNAQVYFPPVLEGGKPPTEPLTCLGEPSSNHMKVTPTSEMRVNQEALVLSARLDLLKAQQNLEIQEDLLSPKPPKPKTTKKQIVNPRKGIAMSSSGRMIKQKLQIDL